MKKLLLLFSLTVALSFSSKAQTSVYHPFPDSDAVWCDGWAYSTGCCMCGVDYEKHSTYQLNGKILINGFTYNMLAVYDSVIDNCIQSTTISTATYYIRQDTALKIVWIKTSVAAADTILYDFNLSIGDTLDASKVYWYQNFSGNWHYIITSIDSISINGQYRKRFNYQVDSLGAVCTLNKIYSIIEGIGDLNGLMNIPGCFESASGLNIFIQNNKVLISSSIDTSYSIHWDCPEFILLNADEIKKNISVTLSPNPFHTTATLKIYDLQFTNYDLKIYDVMGRVVREQQIVNRNSEIVNRDGLGDGLYFYQLRTNNYELIATGKFVID